MGSLVGACSVVSQPTTIVKIFGSRSAALHAKTSIFLKAVRNMLILEAFDKLYSD